MNIDKNIARAIVELDTFFDIIKLKYPETQEDMSSWKTDYSCSCGARFINFLNKKFKDEQEKSFINLIIKNDEVIKKAEEIRSKEEEEYKSRLFHGKVIKMDKSPQSWEELSETLLKKNAIYRAFSIIDNGDSTIEVRFL
jgi:hypothetical protein